MKFIHTAAQPDLAAMIAAAVALLSWLGFAGILVVGRHGASQTERKRDAKSHVGFALQSCAYGLCFAFSRPYFSPLVHGSHTGDWLMLGAIVALAAWSDWFCLSAARTLGKQWALVARVVEGHELVQQGPYAVVRNPIYWAMLVDLAATALTFSSWAGFVPAFVVFFIGTEIRMRSEEKLLRENFSTQFEEYARRVPALIPRLF